MEGKGEDISYKLCQIADQITHGLYPYKESPYDDCTVVTGDVRHVARK
jgi:hypothetical protein